MKRRGLLAASTGLAAAAGCLSGFGNDGSDEGDEDGTDDTGRTDDGPPYEIETIDAPGSEAGTLSIPTAGQVALINFTRQFCPTSAGYLENVGDAYDRLASEFDVGPDGEVVVASVIDWTQGATPSDEELADWWREHDGHWPIAIDRSGALFDAHHDGEFPGTVAMDGEGDVHWRDGGGTTASNVVAGVREAVAVELDRDDIDEDDDEEESTDDEVANEAEEPADEDE